MENYPTLREVENANKKWCKLHDLFFIPSACVWDCFAFRIGCKNNKISFYILFTKNSKSRSSTCLMGFNCILKNHNLMIIKLLGFNRKTQT
jgi:hypothetical protein